MASFSICMEIFSRSIHFGGALHPVSHSIRCRIALKFICRNSVYIFIPAFLDRPSQVALTFLVDRPSADDDVDSIAGQQGVSEFIVLYRKFYHSADFIALPPVATRRSRRRRCNRAHKGRLFDRMLNLSTKAYPRLKLGSAMNSDTPWSRRSMAGAQNQGQTSRALPTKRSRCRLASSIVGDP